jgi:hypothetical protein
MFNRGKRKGTIQDQTKLAYENSYYIRSKIIVGRRNVTTQDQTKLAYESSYYTGSKLNNGGRRTDNTQDQTKIAVTTQDQQSSMGVRDMFLY